MSVRVPLRTEQLNLAWKFFQPSMPVLVTTVNADGGVNIAPFGWVTPVSAEPPLIALALLSQPRKNLTLQNILRQREFTVSLVGAELADRLVKCSHKLPPGMNKFAASGFAAAPTAKVKPPGIMPARVVVECRLKTTLAPGDHTLVVGEVLAVSFDPECFTDDLVLRPERSFPCLHLEQYDGPDGQRHLFLAGGHVREIDVKFEQKFDVVAAFGADRKSGEEQT